MGAFIPFLRTSHEIHVQSVFMNFLKYQLTNAQTFCLKLDGEHGPDWLYDHFMIIVTSKYEFPNQGTHKANVSLHFLDNAKAIVY